MLAGGVPCPPFSKAGMQLGQDDERDLFPEALRLVEEIQPRAVLFENVRGLLDERFSTYRHAITDRLNEMGYRVGWRLLKAAEYGVSQLRPRVMVVGLRGEAASRFRWPEPQTEPAPTVGDLLFDLMAADGWGGAENWRQAANTIAPTIVGGSKKHGGPDLGPTRAKRAWLALQVDGKGIANAPPQPGFTGCPRLTLRMVARLQGFPDDWAFLGGKTRSYRQIGNAFPPPVAHAVGRQIAAALSGEMAKGRFPLEAGESRQLELLY